MVQAAAATLGLSERQTYTLLRRCREAGGDLTALVPGRSSGGIQGVLGTDDNFRNHEFHEGLPHKSHQRFELLLHAAREAFYLVLFPTMAWMEWRGWLAYVFGIIIVGEIVITC